MVRRKYALQVLKHKLYELVIKTIHLRTMRTINRGGITFTVGLLSYHYVDGQDLV